MSAECEPVEKKIDPKMMARIQSLRLMDDDFMTAVFSGDNKLTEFLLRILLSRNDIIVMKSTTQEERHNLYGRSVRLDILAEDENGKQYNVEIQRADKGASKRRTRYNQSLIDSHTLQKNNDFAALPDLYIIFITENDIFKRNQPIYKVSKSIKIEGEETGEEIDFDDGVHTIYVNGSYVGEDSIGWLMHDFRESNADKMHYDEIATKVRHHKQQDKEVNTMCRAFEEYGDERAAIAVAERNEVLVKNLLQQNKLSLEEISTAFGLPIEQVEKIASTQRKA